MAAHALVHPTKRFVVETLCRDIGLEDAVLDLIDNSIDSFIRQHDIALSANLLLKREDDASIERSAIDVQIDEREFVINDTCGGIERASAEKEVFRFGKTIEEDGDGQERGTLSVYGVGLKRAIFKLGKKIVVESRTTKEGFKVDIDTEEWLKDDNEKNPNWTFPIEGLPPARSAARAGTKITVRRLSDDVKARLGDGTFEKRLRDRISVTYSLFLGRYVDVSVNGAEIKAKDIPLGTSGDLKPSVESFQEDRVTVQVVAGLCARPWTTEKAGWYVLCNGRVVVEADRTDLTGWGLKMAGFQPKYRGFSGAAFLFSRYPEDLPWTTTKRGLNRESQIYQQTLNRMNLAARPVMNFLDRMYVTAEEAESPYERELAKDVQQAKFAELTEPRTFSVPAKHPSTKKKVTVQYLVEREKLDLLKRTLKKPDWSARQIGLYALNYLIQRECGE